MKKILFSLQLWVNNTIASGAIDNNKLTEAQERIKGSVRKDTSSY